MKKFLPDKENNSYFEIPENFLARNSDSLFDDIHKFVKEKRAEAVYLDFRSIVRVNILAIEALIILITKLDRIVKKIIAVNIDQNLQMIFSLYQIDKYLIIDGVKEVKRVQPGETPSWTEPVMKFDIKGLSQDAFTNNVEGKKPTSPLNGFGKLRHKIYEIRLSDVNMDVKDVISIWKNEFTDFIPEGNAFFFPKNGIQPGSVAVIHLAGPKGISLPYGLPIITTGLIVSYTDEVSFSFLAPEGHMFAGMITFYCTAEDDDIIARIHALVRASDPIFELSFLLQFGHKLEDRLWLQTLNAFAKRFNSQNVAVSEVRYIDSRIQWRNFINFWQNCAIHTFLKNMSISFQKIRERR
ncbi:MAG: STAS domain-containing protein [Anaerolineaceae bacterium]|nr:STAS domain-containing protein [Anaerolineaceae bacterium]